MSEGGNGSGPTVPPAGGAPPAIPTHIHDWTVLGAIGGGGWGDVYRVRDTLGRERALKVLRAEHAADPIKRARFLNEADLLANLEHPNIVRVFRLARTDPLCIEMELLDGSVASEVPVPLPRAVDITLQLLAGLEAVHRAGHVHRDVKPENLLRADDGKIKLGDFGIAHHADADTLTRAGESLGTPGYLAPELRLAAGSLTPGADIYGAGATLWRLCTGGRPEQLLLADGGREAALARVPEGLRVVVERAVRRRPEDRYPAASAMAEALRSLLAEAPSRSVLPWRPVLAAALAGVAVLSLVWRSGYIPVGIAAEDRAPDPPPSAAIGGNVPAETGAAPSTSAGLDVSVASAIAPAPEAVGPESTSRASLEVAKPPQVAPPRLAREASLEVAAPATSPSPVSNGVAPPSTTPIDVSPGALGVPPTAAVAPVAKLRARLEGPGTLRVDGVPRDSGATVLLTAGLHWVQFEPEGATPDPVQVDVPADVSDGRLVSACWSAKTENHLCPEFDGFVQWSAP